MNEPAPADGPVSHHDVARGAGAALVARLGAVIELVSQPLYVWMFGLAGFGVYAVMWAAINLVENVADLGATSALQRVVPQQPVGDGRTAALYSAIIIGVLPCLVLATLGWLAAPWLALQMNVAPADRPMLVDGISLFVWALPLWAFVEVATSALRARQVFGAEIRLRIMWEQIIRLIIAAILWSLDFGVSGLLYAHLASLAITALLSIRLLARHYNLGWRSTVRPDAKVFRETFLAGLGTLPNNITARIYGDAPPVIANLLVPGAGGAAAAAIYTIARKASSVVQLIRVAMTYVVSPLASAAVGQRDRGAIGAIYAFATRLSIVIALPLTAGMVVGGPALLDLFGPKAQAGWALLAILTVARAAEAFFGQATALQQVISAYHHPLVASLSGIGMALLVGAVVVPFSPMVAIAMGVGAGIVGTAGFAMHQVNRHEGLHPFIPPFPGVLARALVVSLVVALLAGFVLLAPRFVRLLLLIPVIAGGIWLSLRFALPNDDKDAFGRLRARLRI